VGVTKQEGAFVLVAGGVAAVVIGVWAHSKTTGGTGCALTSAGLAIIAEGASKGHSGEAIIASAGVAAACAPLVNAIADRSPEEVKFDLQTAGGTQHYEVPATTIVSPVQSPPPTSPLSCRIKYLDSDFLFELCKDGIVH
jgi:hypothetical protein